VLQHDQAISIQLEAHADKIASLVAENQQLRRENAELRRMY
jgi:regulator of replication initiation timing